MQRKIVLGLIIGMVLLLVPDGLKAEEGSLEANITYASKYIWRGFDLLDNKPAIQPGISYSFGESGFSISLWGSYGLDDTRELDELDFTLDYRRSLNDKVDLSVGYTYYTFPSIDIDNKTHEGYINLSLPKAIFTPTLSIYYDWEVGNGLYATLSGNKEFKLAKDYLPFSSSVTIGYNAGQ